MSGKEFPSHDIDFAIPFLTSHVYQPTLSFHRSNACDGSQAEGSMAGRSWLLLVVFVMPAMAQLEKGFSTDNHVRIHVAYSSGTCDTSTRIELMQGPNSVARGTPDKSCMVD